VSQNQTLHTEPKKRRSKIPDGRICRDTVESQKIKKKYARFAEIRQDVLFWSFWRSNGVNSIVGSTNENLKI